MANPAIVSCTANTWVKVATNVTSGKIYRLKKKTATYLQTYRLTGQAAPTTIEEGVEMFLPDNSPELISASAGIDVYVYCIGVIGSIRVDI